MKRPVWLRNSVPANSLTSPVCSNVWLRNTLFTYRSSTASKTNLFFTDFSAFSLNCEKENARPFCNKHCRAVLLFFCAFHPARRQHQSRLGRAEKQRRQSCTACRISYKQCKRFYTAFRAERCRFPQDKNAAGGCLRLCGNLRAAKAQKRWSNCHSLCRCRVAAAFCTVLGAEGQGARSAACGPQTACTAGRDGRFGAGSALRPRGSNENLCRNYHNFSGKVWSIRKKFRYSLLKPNEKKDARG